MLFYATYDILARAAARAVYRANVDGTDVRQIASLDAKGWPPLSVGQRNNICWAIDGRFRLNIITFK